MNNHQHGPNCYPVLTKRDYVSRPGKLLRCMSSFVPQHFSYDTRQAVLRHLGVVIQLREMCTAHFVQPHLSPEIKLNKHVYNVFFIQ